MCQAVRKNKRDRSPGFHAEFSGDREDVSRRDFDVFRVAAVMLEPDDLKLGAETVPAGGAVGALAAGNAGGDDDGFEKRDATGFFPFFNDLSRDVTAEDMWHADLDAGHAAENPEIKMIQSAGLDFDEDVLFSEFGDRNVCLFQFGRGAVSFKNNSFHFSHKEIS